MTRQTEPSAPMRASRGLVNPQITSRKSSPIAAKGAMPQRRPETPTPEPHWQRIISIALVLCLVAIEIWVGSHHHK